MTEKTKRKPVVVVSMSEELREYIENRAKEAGASLTAVASLMLYEQMKQEKAMKTIADAMKRMDELQGMLDKAKKDEE